MSTPDEAAEPMMMVTSSITITTGFDEDGDPAVWVDPQVANVVEALGMLEYAKTSVLRLHAGESGA